MGQMTMPRRTEGRYDETTVNLLDLMEYVGLAIEGSKVCFAPKDVLANDWLFAFMSYAGKMIAAAPAEKRQALLQACVRDLQDLSDVELENVQMGRERHAQAH